ncbi:MAG: EcsC family protein [Lachnospiraceae bacterium]|nr:EcsC family protein [Lachnospiraceae bacterium]
MNKQTKKKMLTREEITNLLDTCYDKCLYGIPKVSSDVKKMCEDYVNKHSDKEEACKALLRNQIAKCTTSGFVLGLGGIFTMPVTLPANLGSVMYVQMRMIACVAYMNDYELENDQTKAFVYACLAGVNVEKMMQYASDVYGVEISDGLINKIKGKILRKIEQKVAFRLVRKFGTKSIANLGKIIPGVGAVIGGSLDLAETKSIAKRAYKWFHDGDFSMEKTEKEEVVIAEDGDFEEMSGESEENIND